MNETIFLSVMVFLTVASAVLLTYILLGNRKSRLVERLERIDMWLPGRSRSQLDQIDISPTISSVTRTAIPKVGATIMPKEGEQKKLLQTQLLHAGLYSHQAMAMYLGVKLIIIGGPALVATLLGLLGVFPLKIAFLTGCSLGILGLIGPSFWLDYCKNKRQEELRRAIPDAMDVMVICLEGGLSVQAAVRKVAGELKTAHPLMARELSIVEREIQLGQTSGQAILNMGVRTDLEEIRSLASVINQADKFGSSLVRALRVHAETLRQRRQQAAEERAQKAAVKVLFPTILCIFPAMFVVILGPAAYRIMQTFSK